MPDVELNMERVAKALNDADTLLINAGAGMGVDSRMPDFREPQVPAGHVPLAMGALEAIHSQKQALKSKAVMA